MRVNFDANASIKPIPAVLECLASYKGQFLNPSSVHHSGQEAKRVLDEARLEISELLGVGSEDKIIFTSGATEANNAALRLTESAFSRKPELICSAVEHSAVLESLRQQARLGAKLSEVSPIDFEDHDKLASLIPEDLTIFSLMAANNETGQIFDIKNISKIVRARSARVRIHCDAVQAVGKIDLNFSALGVDTLAISGHKLGALAGVGALVISRYCQIDPWVFGGPQEFGLRAGTENILGIKTLAIACKEARLRLEQSDTRMKNAKETLLAFIGELGESARLNNFGINQLPNTISVRFPGIKADDLVVALDLCGVAISAGSACTSGRPSPSHVLLAHGLSTIEAKETVRLSFEPTVSQSELDFGISALRETLIRMLSLRRAA